MKGFINLTHTNNGKIAKAKSELQTEIQNAINGIIDTFYSKQQVQQLIANLAGITFKKVEILPTENILTNVIYLVPFAEAGEQNLYEEYMYIDDMWEKIGTTAIDLSNYVSLEEFNKLVNNETQIVPTSGGLAIGGAIKSSRYEDVAIGSRAQNTNGPSTAIGANAKAGFQGTALGYGADSSIGTGGLALGRASSTTANYAIQLGLGTNSTANSLQIQNDNIYNHETHTATFQNLELNGENILNMFPTIEEINDDEEV